MDNKVSLFASLHILMPAIPDGPEDDGRRLQRYWYRESRCQVRTGWQKPLWLHSFAKSAQSASKFSLCLCVFCAFLWLRNTFNQRNLRLKNSPNLRLIKDLRHFKSLYNCRELSTSVESSLQNNLFMQNKANYRKVKLNVNKVLTKDYDQMDTWSIRKTKPIQSQLKPIKANSKPIKANIMPKQTQFKPKQTQFLPAISVAGQTRFTLCKFFLFLTFLCPGYNLPMQTWTIQKLLNWMTEYYTEKGIDAPRLNAELLLSHVLTMERIELP
jgi:hypothetical protein